MTTNGGDQILPEDRRAGVCLHITTLPGLYGIGEIGREACRFIDQLRHMGLRVWQFLPTGPTAYGDSPYQPLSTFAGNEMLVDVADLIDRGLLTAAEAMELTNLPHDHVDYGSVIPIKSRLLKIAAGRFASVANSKLTSQYDAFLDANDEQWLHDYALFRILKTMHGERSWPEWEQIYVRRDVSALRDVADAAREDIEKIKIVQFLFHDQWQHLKEHAHANGITLFGDMPIYIALDSADAWANRDILQLNGSGRAERVAGVPPDYFSEDGQLWGNPLYDWASHAEDDYRWWVARLRASTELVDLVRIDHFRGFEGYWSIPADSKTARVGTWEPGPGDAVFDAMRNALGHLPIVAENLGVITPEVEALRERHGIPGMLVLQFEASEENFDLAKVESNVVCYTGTHDNDTTIGWFNGSPDDIRSADEIAATREAVLELTGGTPETINIDLIKAAYRTEARLALAPMQDYLGLGSEARMNTPGKPANNWRWRMRDVELTDHVQDDIASLVSAEGRGTPG